MSGLLEGLGLAFAGLWLLSWGAVSLGAPRLRWAAALSPGRRAVMARAWLYGPLWAPALVLVGALLPGLLGALAAVGDHCEVGERAWHHHLCVLHPPHASHEALPWAAVALLAAALGGGALRALRGLWVEARLAAGLLQSSRPSPLGEQVRLLEQDEPLAFASGLWRPTILLSTGLLRRASAPTLGVVLSHERAHLARRDTWLAAVDRLAGGALPVAAAAPLLAQLSLAREQACDEAAARELGGPLAVAQALLEIARLRLCAHAAGVSMASASLEARVLHLLHPPAQSWRGPLTLAAALVGLLALGAGPVHDLIERLLHLLFHP
jgi:Zn-dependent protease with chaperone function